MPHTNLADPPTAPHASPATLPIRVVLADDHQLVRRSARLLLERGNDVEVIAEAADLFTAIRHVSGHLPHVLVLDLQMPNRSSIEAVRRLRAQVPETAIVVTAMDDDPAYARAMLEAGAVGYVLKENGADELLTAVRSAAHGQRIVSARVVARLDALRRSVDGDGLSTREAEVLRLIALGFTSAEISEKLHVSRRTVESHRRRIHRKLGLARRHELVDYALSRGLVGR
jgi:two-component system, NarL family, response regulator NreC